MESLMPRFDGECALITGCGSGIGLAAAKIFGAEGCRVVATVEHEDQIADIHNIPGVALARKLDVTSEEDWQSVVGEAARQLGGVDILFNNAGVTVWGDLQATDRALWDRMLLINLTGQYLGCRSVIDGMLAKRKGSIVNMASINAIRGNKGLIGYSAAKGGVAAMTRAIALDHADQGIRANCVCPGTIDTPMAQTSIDIADDKDLALSSMVAKHPMARLGLAEEVASVALFLASQDAAYVTGQAIPVDGGRSIR